MTGERAYLTEAEPATVQSGVTTLLNTRIDDKRVQARAYGRWVAMLRGRACPSIEDLEPVGVAGPCDILIDLRRDAEDPELACIGGALIADCGRRGMQRLSDVPPGSYLALLAARHREAVLTRQPIAFDGERSHAGGMAAEYRGILLPLASDGETVDFIHGTIGWREPADRSLAAEIEKQVEGVGAAPPSRCRSPLWPADANGARRSRA